MSSVLAVLKLETVWIHKMDSAAEESSSTTLAETPCPRMERAAAFLEGLVKASTPKEAVELINSRSVGDFAFCCDGSMLHKFWLWLDRGLSSDEDRNHALHALFVCLPPPDKDAFWIQRAAHGRLTQSFLETVRRRYRVGWATVVLDFLEHDLLDDDHDALEAVVGDQLYTFLVHAKTAQLQRLVRWSKTTASDGLVEHLVQCIPGATPTAKDSDLEPLGLEALDTALCLWDEWHCRVCRQLQQHRNDTPPVPRECSEKAFQWHQHRIYLMVRVNEARSQIHHLAEYRNEQCKALSNQDNNSNDNENNETDENNPPSPLPLQQSLITSYPSPLVPVLDKKGIVVAENATNPAFFTPEASRRSTPLSGRKGKKSATPKSSSSKRRPSRKTKHRQKRTEPDENGEDDLLPRPSKLSRTSPKNQAPSETTPSGPSFAPSSTATTVSQVTPLMNNNDLVPAPLEVSYPSWLLSDSRNADFWQRLVQAGSCHEIRQCPTPSVGGFQFSPDPWLPPKLLGHERRYVSSRQRIVGVGCTFTEGWRDQVLSRGPTVPNDGFG